MSLCAGRAFVPLMSQSDTAFEEIYCFAFAVLDNVWLDRKASYMEFNAVMKDVKTQLEKALASHPASIQQLQVKLGLLPNML